MKKFFLLCFLLFDFIFVSYAQQTVVPREIYVGDHAQLRWTFQSSKDLFSKAAGKVEGDFLIFPKDSAVFPSDLMSSCSIQNICLQKIGITYTFIIDFIPWKTGVLDFGSVDLGVLCGTGSADDKIEFQKVEVSSLSKKLGVTALRTPQAPLLLPGTDYLVWSLITFFVIFLVLLALFLMRFSSIVRGILFFKERFGYKKNAFFAKRKISALSKFVGEDADFAMQWQTIMRAYLAYRFSTPFVSVTAKNIAMTIARATGDMLSFEQDSILESIQGTFIRTDYIRYARDSIDSKREPHDEYSTVLSTAEKKSIIENTIGNINKLESSGEVR